MARRRKSWPIAFVILNDPVTEIRPTRIVLGSFNPAEPLGRLAESSWRYDFDIVDDRSDTVQVGNFCKGDLLEILGGQEASQPEHAIPVFAADPA
jgi:hypothetical protein